MDHFQRLSLTFCRNLTSARIFLASFDAPAIFVFIVRSTNPWPRQMNSCKALSEAILHCLECAHKEKPTNKNIS